MSNAIKVLGFSALFASAVVGCWAEDVSGYESQRRRESAYIGPEGIVTGEPRTTMPTPGSDRFAPPDQPPGRMPGATVGSVPGPIVPTSVPYAPTSVPIPDDIAEPSEPHSVPIPTE
jgi:hypothetical protein